MILKTNRWFIIPGFILVFVISLSYSPAPVSCDKIVLLKEGSQFLWTTYSATNEPQYTMLYKAIRRTAIAGGMETSGEIAFRTPTDTALMPQSVTFRCK